MFKLKLISFFASIAVLQIASARFENESTRAKYISELTKSLSNALETNHGRENFDVFRNVLVRFEYDCKRHAINKVTQSDFRDKKEKTDTIEKYYTNNRYENFEDQDTFKFKKSDDTVAIQKKSADIAKQTVRMCANMEAISSGQAPNI